METVVKIDGKDIKFKATAAIPRLYRMRFGRDILTDFQKLAQKYEGNQFDAIDLEVFENAAYIMAKYADNTVPDTPEEWLDGFNVMDIYLVLPEILKLWNINMATRIESKKNLMKVTGS